jgi:hypothetical protein
MLTDDEYKINLFDVLDAAVINGYTEILDWTPEVVAADVAELSGDYEEEEISRLIPLIEEWQKMTKGELE